MREILFKAKRIDTGEWVEGTPIFDYRDEQWRIITQLDYSTGTCITSDSAPRVSQKTICQFTGLYDKNDNKIWENDIVDTHNRGHGFRRLEKVIYENGGYFPISTHGWECEPDADEIEVIGNIFDNADLVKELGYENN